MFLASWNIRIIIIIIIIIIIMLIYFKPRRSYVTQGCYEFISIWFLTVFVVICCLVPATRCILNVFS